MRLGSCSDPCGPVPREPSSRSRSRPPTTDRNGPARRAARRGGACRARPTGLPRLGTARQPQAAHPLESGWCPRGGGHCVIQSPTGTPSNRGSASASFRGTLYQHHRQFAFLLLREAHQYHPARDVRQDVRERQLQRGPQRNGDGHYYRALVRCHYHQARRSEERPAQNVALHGKQRFDAALLLLAQTSHKQDGAPRPDRR